MKSLKYSLLSLFIVGLMQAPLAVAAPLSYTCDIKSVGAKVKGKSRKAIITLDDAGGAFTDQAFTLNPKAYRSMLATSLAAATSKLQIEIIVDLAKNSDEPVISQLQLIP